MIRLVSAGAALTGLVTAALWLAFGRDVIVSGMVFGALATGIQGAAVAILRPAVNQPFQRFMARWGVGMGFRMAGIVLFVVAVVIDRERFPPLPTALGYLGVLVPLLFTETRFLR